jgi:signal transduction histidine kinase
LRLKRVRGPADYPKVLKRLSFRAKLLLVLFVPFLALVVVAAAGLSDRFSELHAQEQYGTLVVPMRSLGDLSRAVQDEAVVTSWYSAGGRGADVPLDQVRAHTDLALAQFKADEGVFVDGGASPDAIDKLNEQFGSIKAIRRSVDAVPSSSAFDSLLAIDGDVLGFGETVARNLHDPEIAARVSRAFGLQRENEELAREAGVILPVLATGRAEGFATWIGAITAQSRYELQFVNSATPSELAAFDSGMGSRAGATDLLRPVATDAPLPSALPSAAATGVTPSGYYASYQHQAKALDRASRNVGDVIATAAATSAKTARSDVWTYGGVAVFAMLLTLVLIWFVTRAVVRPVKKLTEAARDMSERRLPQLIESMNKGGDVTAIEPVVVEVASEDEIGELAKAFNDVEAVTTQVALEQSRLLRKGMGDLFVNLARRNQSLLERQLELLDELERNEHDPTALDSLFKLDHMATRMRRNAESLLVLSGAEQPRQWQQPIALVDVVRAAAAEIADFPRVELLGLDQDLAVSGRAVADLAHLLAELLENATSFSPPDAAVVVSGAPTGNGFVVAVTDQGIGFPADRLDAANELLRHPPVVGLALSRALGLHVVGLLASRHGISVELRSGAPLGTVAMVTLPHGILEGTATPEPLVPVPEGAPTPPLTPRRPADDLVAVAPVRPDDEPPVEEWGRESGVVSPVDVIPADARPAASERPPSSPGPVVPEAVVPEVVEPEVVDPEVVEPEVVEPEFVEPESFESTAEPGFVGGDPSESDPDGSGPLGPLPARVPGRHMSHQPGAGGADGSTGDSPRPDQVHEMLTRHQLGKRRGQQGTGDGGSSVGGNGSAAATRVWEDDRQ